MELTAQQIKELNKTHYINIEDKTEDKSSGTLKEERRIIHWITTPSLDSVADRVMPKGVDVTRFVETKTVFRNHMYDQPIGVNVNLKITNEGIKAVTHFSNKTQLANDEYNLHLEGVINGWSIGFKPVTDKKTGFPIPDSVEWLPDTNIRIFHQCELLEYSSTGIPANADCLDIAKMIVKSSEYINEIDYKLELIKVQNELKTCKTEFETLKNLFNELKTKSNNTEIKKEIDFLFKILMKFAGKTSDKVSQNDIKTQIEKGIADAFGEFTGWK